MRKKDEIAHPGSCLNKASDDEMLFVLLGRDLASTVAVEAWINERIALGKNRVNDSQIMEAQAWVEKVREEQRAKIAENRELDALKRELWAALKECPFAIRVREGAALENEAASVAATLAQGTNILKEVAMWHEAISSVRAQLESKESPLFFAEHATTLRLFKNLTSWYDTRIKPLFPELTHE